MYSKGKVILIGAGPGDPGLLTVKAEQLLKQAQVVVYDRLVSEDILALIPASAELIDVGKNVGDHPVPQDEINQILVRKAMNGKQVLRLKGGDSFVFGRGGEELEELRKKSIDFEVVPGITSAVSVPAYAGIPLTHRDYSSSFHVITGHRKKSGELCLDYEALVRLNGTLVFLMSVATIGQIAEGLIRGGMSPKTECAVIQNGARPNQKKYLSVLETVAETVKENSVVSPAIFVVGKVCCLSERLDWFDRLPLKGKRILVTSPQEHSHRLADRLSALGAEVDKLPAIKTEKYPFALPDLSRYTALTFTSAVGVQSFFDRMFEQGMDARNLFDKKIAVIGSQTAKTLLTYGIRADFIPSAYYGKTLAEEMIAKRLVTQHDRLLLVEPVKPSRDLPDILSEYQIPFDELAVYQTHFADLPSVDGSCYDYITLTSASCADSLAAQAELSAFQGTVVCIGKKTAEAAEKYQLNLSVAREATLDAMIEQILGDDKRC